MMPKVRRQELPRFSLAFPPSFSFARSVRRRGLVRLPEYRDVVVSIEQTKNTDLPGIVPAPEEKGRVLRVAKMNVEYEFAVAYVFIVTLVGSFILF